MSYLARQLVPVPFKVTPKSGAFGQDAAVWSVGYDVGNATFAWNAVQSRAAGNQSEINRIVQAHMDATGLSHTEAYNALVLESGFFRLAASPVEETEALEIDKATAEAIREKAAAAGLSAADYLRQNLGIQ